MCQIVLIIWDLGGLPGRPANLDLERAQVGAASFAEGIVRLHRHHFRGAKRYSRPGALGICEANLSRSASLRRARGKDVVAVYEKGDIGPVAAGREVVRGDSNAVWDLA